MEENEEWDFSTTDAGSSVLPLMQRAPPGTSVDS